MNDFILAIASEQRILIGFLTTFLLFMFIGGRAINYLRQCQHGGQPIRDCGPKSHLETKKGTPTMGGLIIILATLLSSLLWVDMSDPYVLLILAVVVFMCALGFIDDYLKVKARTSSGLKGKTRIIVSFLFSLLVAILIQQLRSDLEIGSLYVPFIGYINIGYLYPVFMMFVIVGTANAVNLTDGLDGLVTIPVVMVLLVFAIIAYYGFHNQEGYDAREIAVLLAILAGSCVAFLWFNCYPAQIFMGDTGSLALGGAIGVTVTILKQEWVLAVVGIIFVVEASSVILQVSYFKFTKGKRIFLMAPIHHHFEHKNIHEVKIVIRFWIISIIASILGIAIAVYG